MINYFVIPLTFGNNCTAYSAEIGNNLGIKLNVVLTNLYYNGGEKMNNVKKYLGLLLMLPLFTISLTVAGQVETVDAANISTIGGTGGHNYGNTNLVGSSSVDDGPSGSKKFGSMTAHIVCGDRLCSESARTFEAKTLASAPVAVNGPSFKEVDIISASANSDDLFKAMYNVYAGDRDVVFVKLLITSDKDSMMTTIGGIGFSGFSPVSVLLKASDPGSISAEVVDWEYRR